MIMKMEVGKRENTPTPYRIQRYTETEADEKAAQSAINRLPARFTAFPVIRKRASLEIAFLYPESPVMLCFLM